MGEIKGGQVYRSDLNDTTFYIHYVADDKRVVIRWRHDRTIAMSEQTMTMLEVRDLLRIQGAELAE